MAYLIKRGEIYYAAWYRPGSRVPIKRSTKSTKEGEAQKIADHLQALDRKEITAARVLMLVDEIRAGGKATVRQHFTAWQSKRKREWKKATINFYRVVCDSFLADLGAKADGPITRIDRTDIANWHTDVSREKSITTANNYLGGIRSALKAAVQEGLLEINPADQVASIRNRRDTGPRKSAFTLDQVRQLMAVADGEWPGLILLAIYTGQRLGDVASITWEQVDLDKGTIRLTTTKTGARLAIPIAPALRAHLAKITPKVGAIHPKAAKIAATGHVGQLSNGFGRLLVAAGLRDAKPTKGEGQAGRRNINELSFHSLRHTAVTMLKEAGVPHAVVQALIGHESEAISQHYTHVGDDALRAATARMPDVTS